ncbi:MAG TPA: hypothetical protein VF546_17050 [Pyrinomonadaceae bacterium]|jgi:hypothetical protein
MLHDFTLAGRRVRLWQRPGETYTHVLLKALGYAMYVGEYPRLEIEPKVGLRYVPDLLARADEQSGAAFAFWGECGLVSMRKVAWLLKHAGLERLVLFKLIGNAHALAAELRAAVPVRYRRAGRLMLVNFVPDVAARAAGRRIAQVPQSWYTLSVI